MDDPYYTMHKEHEAWLALVKASRETVITDADWRTSATVPQPMVKLTTSDGIAFLVAIKAWGDALAELRIEEFKRTLRAAIQEAGNAIALLQASK